jgi:hypothetical protein
VVVGGVRVKSVSFKFVRPERVGRADKEAYFSQSTTSACMKMAVAGRSVWKQLLWRSQAWLEIALRFAG